MASIVMRVRPANGDPTDVSYEDRDAADENEVIERAVTPLRNESGFLRCRPGDRLIVQFARGVATIEVAPLGAVL